MWEKQGATRIGIECYYTGRQRLEYNPYRSVSVPYVIFGAMAEPKVAAHSSFFLNLENLGSVRQSHWDPILLPNTPCGWAVDRGCVGTARWTRVINGGVRFVF
jgi:iron complex outermembrane receptor protein